MGVQGEAELHPIPVQASGWRLDQCGWWKTLSRESKVEVTLYYGHEELILPSHCNDPIQTDLSSGCIHWFAVCRCQGQLSGLDFRAAALCQAMLSRSQSSESALTSPDILVKRERWTFAANFDPALTGEKDLRRAQHQFGQPRQWKPWCARATCRGCVKAGGGHAPEFPFLWSPAGSVPLHLFFAALQEETTIQTSHLYFL